MSASGVPIGIILDAVGPRYTTIIGSLTFAAGLLSFAAAPALSDQLYYAGFFFLSLGGPAIITATVSALFLSPIVTATVSALLLSPIITATVHALALFRIITAT